MSRKRTFRQATTSAQPATSADEEHARAAARARRSPRAPGTKTSESDDQDHEHHREGDRLGGDDREGDELAREADLA